MANIFNSNVAADLGYMPLSSIGGAVAVTPSDAADLPTSPAKGLWVGGAGAVKVTLINGNTVTFSGIPAGTLLPIVVTRVFATGGTTATLMLALY